MSIADFEVLNRIGAGSFGVVYKARCRATSEICVLKELDLSHLDQHMKNLALNEATILKGINSHYIVKFSAFFLDKASSKLFIAMEYCPQGDLALFLRSQMGKLLKEQIIWRFALQILIGLRDLHRKKILHRDIKTANIFLTKDHDIRIGDLGVAKTLKEDFTHTKVGTPYYLSPEMCEEKPYNQKTDIWAFGCLLYELCTFKHPFEANNMAALSLKIIMGKYTPIPSHYSKQLQWVVKSCLSVDYKRRPTAKFFLGQEVIKKKIKEIGGIVDEQQNQKQTTECETTQRKEQCRSSSNGFKSNPSKLAFGSKDSKEKKEKKIQSLVKKHSGQKPSAQKVDREQKYQRSKSKQPPPQEDKVLLKPRYKKSPSDISPNNDHFVPSPSRVTEHEEGGGRIKVERRKIPKEEKIERVQPSPELKVKEKERNVQIRLPNRQNHIKINVLVQKNQKPMDDDELLSELGIKNGLISPKGKKQPVESHKDLQRSNEIENALLLRGTHAEQAPLRVTEVNERDRSIKEEIEDNIPFREDGNFQEETPSKFEIEDQIAQTLIEGVESNQAMRTVQVKEQVDSLQRRIDENCKRRDELMVKKQQNEAYLLRGMSRDSFERIKFILMQEDEKQIEKVMTKLKDAKVLPRFYKIFHYEMEIERCMSNMSNSAFKIKQIKKQ